MPPARRPDVPSPYAEQPWLASYPEGVPGDYDFPSVPVTRLLDDAAASFPTNPAVTFLSATLTYKQLKHEVDAFASALAGLGVRKGDRVALVLPNCPQNVITFFAVLRLGAVVVQHNPLYTESELQHQLADCGARVVVCHDRVYDRIAAVRARTAVEQVVVASLADYLPARERLALKVPVGSARRRRERMATTLPKGAPVRRFRALVRSAGLPARQVPIEAEADLALLQYTGGTTGTPKGAMLTHANLVSNAYMNRLWDVGATAGKEVTLGVLPLFHVYGLTVAMLNTVLLGGNLVLVPRFDLDDVLRAIEQHHTTLLPGVPPIYQAIADSPLTRSRDLRSVRLCVSGAMRLPPEVQDRFEKITESRLVEGYGTTETSPSTHCNPVVGERRRGSIGLPLPGTRCRIVDEADPGIEVPVGSSGELAIAGPQVFLGYWQRQDPDLLTPDGFLLTGDIAVMDEQGWFTIVGRKKELIIAGGFNVYPAEVEQVLLRLDGVRDAVVLGIPDRYRGETVKAVVVRSSPELTESDVLAHCRSELTTYKVPKVVEFREELPRSAVGKVLRRVLLEEELARIGPQERPGSVPAAARQVRREEDLPTGPDPGPRQAQPGAAAEPRVPVVPKGTSSRRSPIGGTVSTDSTTRATPRKVAPAEAGRGARATPAKATPTRPGAAKAGPAKAGPAKATPTRPGAAKAGPAKAGPAKASPAEASPAEASPAEASPAEASPATSSSPGTPIPTGGAAPDPAPQTRPAPRTPRRSPSRE